MGDWLREKFMKLVFGVIGLALLLGYWSFFGDDHNQGKTDTLSTLPVSIFEADAKRLVMSITLNQPGILYADFSRGEEETETINVEQKLAPGTHELETRLSKSLSYGYVQVSIPEPTVGAKLSWKVEYNYTTIREDEMELEKPLARGYGFFDLIEFGSVDDLDPLKRKNRNPFLD